MFLFLLRAWEVRGAEQRWGKARRWSPGDISCSRACAGVPSPPEGSHLEQVEHGVAENPLGVSLGDRERCQKPGRVFALCGVMPCMAEIQPQLGPQGTMAVVKSSKNHNFHILFKAAILQEDFTVIWGKSRCIVGAQEDSKSSTSDALAFGSSHVHPSQ